MENIKLTGLQIVSNKRMLQSKRRRLTVELTEQDSKVMSGVLSVWEDNEMIFNAELTPTEIQGNDNGTEKQVETLVGKNSIYVQFKRFCESKGINYENQKKLMGVAHLRELEKVYTTKEITDLLNDKMNELSRRLN